jgi:hypothetical protein
MASTAAQLSALAADPQFKNRVGALFIQQAGVVYNEAPRTITAISLANPGVITNGSGHGITVGVTTSIMVTGSNSTPSLDGPQVVYAVSTTQLRTTVNVTGAGNAGSFTIPARRDFSKYVMANSAGVEANWVATVANRTNLVAGNTTYDFGAGRVVTDVSDASILSQLASDWSMMAGI